MDKTCSGCPCTYAAVWYLYVAEVCVGAVLQRDPNYCGLGPAVRPHYNSE